MMSTPRLLTRSTLAVLVVVATVAPTCLSQLNGKCAHTTRTRVDENLLSLFQIRSFDQRLPGGQADQGDGSRFFHGECFGLDRHVILFDRTEFRECTDSPVSRARIDFVAGLESTHSRSDPDHDPGHVMAQNEREAVRQNALELAVSDFGIQKVDTSGVNLDQDVILAQLRVCHVAGTTAPESRATTCSIPVPTSGASGCRSGTAWRCMFDPMSARFASSFSRNGISDAATETSCFGDTSM